MKRLSCFVFMICLFFCSCSIEQKPAELQKARAIPESGIVDHEILSQLKKENGICVFTGESNRVPYAWTVFGSNIKTPADLNLKVDVLQETENSVSFKTEICADFELTLSLYLNNVWSDASTVLTVNGKSQNGVTLTKEKNSVINIVISEPGQYEIIAVTEQTDADAEIPAVQSDGSFSEEKAENTPKLSDGEQTEQDPFHTDPIPQGKPMPAEPQDQKVDENKSYTCTFSIECSAVLNNLGDLNADKLDAIPGNGVIYPKQTVTFYEGESVFDVLQRICEENDIHLEASWTPIYNSTYIEGIHNLYEFDCGTGSGWMYRVNGWYPNYGCSRYQLTQGDNVEWRYTCDLGADIGGGFDMG